MKNLYFDFDISHGVVCHFPHCDEVSPTFRFKETDQTISELRAIDFDDLEYSTEEHLKDKGWEKIADHWHCPLHTSIAKKEAA